MDVPVKSSTPLRVLTFHCMVSLNKLQFWEVPKGWDKLSLSLISVEAGKTIAKTACSVCGDWFACLCFWLSFNRILKNYWKHM
ncbi:hypothetical protein L1987_42559 [Smallanthus sonchifolius]|uniref:Uncharacterized protein n=1 Tax=Smallanthus sonchifolius TaxID=185202 RepID=A0ACB9GKF7_9ASTR|nr:hypothetical protein L1987_42559 [Smallanthus sonchifolius]